MKQFHLKQGYAQEDMISFGFDLLHWQPIEGGNPINIWTLLRICEAFGIRVGHIVRSLDDDFAMHKDALVPPRLARRRPI